MKNQKGITLVALILIIVVLLVLAGISVSLVLSNEEKVPSNTSNDQNGTNNVEIEYQPEDGEMPEPESDSEIGVVIKELCPPISESLYGSGICRCSG